MFTKDLDYGSVGTDVINLQKALNALNFATITPLPFFGPQTKAGVIKYQLAYGLTGIGRFGPLTRAKLNAQMMNSREWLYNVALRCLGTDASPNDLAPDEVGCMETVSDILIKSGFNFPVILATYTGYNEFLSRPKDFIKVEVPSRGDIVISPSGYAGAGGSLTNGHVGICGDGEGDLMQIMSNNSYTGKWDIHYTIKTWRERYVGLGHYPMVYFRKT